MIAEILATVSATPLIIGGLLGPIHIGLMVLFLISSAFMFTILSQNLDTTRALGVSSGLYVFCVSLSIFII
jgi:hypothetical protein